MAHHAELLAVTLMVLLVELHVAQLVELHVDQLVVLHVAQLAEHTLRTTVAVRHTLCL